MTVIRAFSAISETLPGDVAVFYVDKNGTAHLTTRELAEKAGDKIAILEP